MRRFMLWRHSDETGVSGTGVIAEGVIFSDGTCSLRWRTDKRSTAVYGSFDDLIAIHGHGGKTVPLWIDGEEDAPRQCTIFDKSGERTGISYPVSWVIGGAADVNGETVKKGATARMRASPHEIVEVNGVYVTTDNAIMVSVSGLSPCNMDAVGIDDVEVVPRRTTDAEFQRLLDDAREALKHLGEHRPQELVHEGPRAYVPARRGDER